MSCNTHRKFSTFESVEIEEQIPVLPALPMSASVALCAVVKSFYMKSDFILQSFLNRNDDFHVKIYRGPHAYSINNGNPTSKGIGTSEH